MMLSPPAEGNQWQQRLNTQHTQARLAEYVAMLLRWNKVHNLTAWHDPKLTSSMLLASLEVTAPLVPMANCEQVGDLLSESNNRPRVLDLGTGGGIPGIPLAIARPDCDFVLLDSRTKRIAFVSQVIGALGLSNATPELSRIEDYQFNQPTEQTAGRPTGLFDCVVSRAFGSIAQITQATARLLHPRGIWVLERGELSAEESSWCEQHGYYVATHSLPHPAKGQILVLHQCL